MLARTIGRAAAVAGFILSGAAALAAGWEPAAGDEKNAAQGCAAMPGDDYVCTFLRCDAKGSLNFYAAAPGPDITGNVVMDIDGQRFPMTFRSPGSPRLAYTNRADTLPPGFLAALKTGKIMKIREAGLKAGYDTIPLRNAEREIGRLEQICGIEAAAAPPAPPVTQAQASAPPADTDAPRRGVAQGAALCKANLGSAPPDLKLGEVEEFCTCMGVHEFAMSDMTNEAKASLRPRQQQMCVEIVRKQGAAPAPATTPAAPSSPPPAPPVTAEQPAASVPAPVAASQPPAVERIEHWTLNTNITGAPVAYARATDSNILAGIMMYCRAKDSIGLRVLYKDGAHAKQLSLNMAGDITELDTDKNGLVSQKAWADFLRDRLETEKYFTPERRKQPGYSGEMLISAGKRDSGMIGLDGLGDARKRLLAMCATEIAKGAPEGNYITTGLAAFATEVLVGSAPPGTPSSVAVVAPRAPETAQPVARRPGMLPFEGEWRQSTHDTCEYAQTVSRKSIVERRPGATDTFKVLGVKQLSDTAFNLTVRVHDTLGHGTPTRNQVLRLAMKGENAMSGTGPYFDGGTVEFLRCPDRAPSAATAVAPRVSAPKPKAAPNCTLTEAQIEAQFTRESQQLRARVTAEFERLGYLPKPTSCANMRRINAFHQEVIKRASTCESLANRHKIIAAHRGYLAKNNEAIRRNSWCG